VIDNRSRRCLRPVSIGEPAAGRDNHGRGGDSQDRPHLLGAAAVYGSRGCGRRGQPQRGRRLREAIGSRTADRVETLCGIERLDFQIELLDERHRQRSQIGQITTRDRPLDDCAVAASDACDTLPQFRREMRDEGIPLQHFRPGSHGTDGVLPRECPAEQLLTVSHDGDCGPLSVECHPGNGSSGVSGARPGNLRKGFWRGEHMLDEESSLKKRLDQQPDGRITSASRFGQRPRDDAGLSRKPLRSPLRTQLRRYVSGMCRPLGTLHHVERGHFCPALSRTRANEDARIRSELDACNAGHGRSLPFLLLVLFLQPCHHIGIRQGRGVAERLAFGDVAQQPPHDLA
jgi:hypothetical protein